MFGGSRAGGRCPIGVDLGAHSIKLLQLERRCEGTASWSVAAAATRAMPTDLPPSGPQRITAISNIIRAMLSEAPFRGRTCVSCLPYSLIQFKNLRLPPMPADELRQAIEWEAADRLSAENGPVQFQYFDAGLVRQGDESRQEIILMTALPAAVEEHVTTLVQAGLGPMAVDVAPAALARVMAAHAEHDEQMREDGTSAPARVIIDVGHGATQVVIVREGRIVFVKLIDVGPVNDDATVAELARELQLCLRYYSVTFRGVRPDRAALIGEADRDAELARKLSEQLGIRVEAVSPLRHVDTSRMPEQARRAGLGRWAVAAGLSLRGLVPQTSQAEVRGAAA